MHSVLSSCVCTYTGSGALSVQASQFGKDKCFGIRSLAQERGNMFPFVDEALRLTLATQVRQTIVVTDSQHTVNTQSTHSQHAVNTQSTHSQHGAIIIVFLYKTYTFPTVLQLVLTVC